MKPPQDYAKKDMVDSEEACEKLAWPARRDSSHRHEEIHSKVTHARQPITGMLNLWGN
jgi:hypothetical protein